MTKTATNNSWLSKVPIELHGHRKKLNYFIDSLEQYRNAKGLERAEVSVAEVGCSNGRNISFPLAEYGYRMTGIDIHQASISWAVKNNTFENLSFVCEDFSLFNSSDKFDAIILSDILEHVEDPLHIVKLAKSQLKAGGILLICIPNGFGPYEIEQRILRITYLNRLIEKAIRLTKRLLGRNAEKQTEYNYESGHIQFFKKTDIDTLAKKIDCEIVDSKNGALFGGDLSYIFGILLPFIVKPSLWLADYVPSWLASTWYFRLQSINKKT